MDGGEIMSWQSVLITLCLIFLVIVASYFCLMAVFSKTNRLEDDSCNDWLNKDLNAGEQEGPMATWSREKVEKDNG